MLFLELLSLGFYRYQQLITLLLSPLGHNLLGSNRFSMIKLGLVFSYINATLFISHLIKVSFHRINIIGFTLSFWSGHLVHCSIPVLNPDFIINFKFL